MNAEWAIEQLDDFIRATTVTYVPSPPSSIGFHSYETVNTEDEIVKRAQIVERILERVVPGWRSEIKKKDRQKWSVHYEASIRAREEISRAEEVKENLDEYAPDLSAAQFHPWIWEGAKSLWQSGHYREAVGGAIRKLNAEAQNKVGRRDVSETDLFKQSFTTDEPKPGKSRLRRIRDDGSDTYRSVQRGAMTFAEGVFAGIRNPLSHEVVQELSELEALEYLAALSVLARWVDTAIVEVSE